MSAIAVKVCDLAQQVFEMAAVSPSTKLEVLIVTDYSSRRAMNLTVRLREAVRERGLNVAVYETTKKGMTPIFLRGSTRVALIDMSSSDFMSDPEIRLPIIRSFMTVSSALNVVPEELIF